MATDRPDQQRAFDSGFDAGFATENKTYFGAFSLTFAGILYASLITVIGVVVAMLTSRSGWLAVGLAAVGYVGFAVLLFVWGVTGGRRIVIHWCRHMLELPEDRG